MSSLKVGTLYHGFRLEGSEKVEEIHSRAYRFTHEKSGARLLYLENDDDNKVFSITFRTPPDDSTGVAHIVEHSVLCGSRKFPMKEPFVELVKGSLNTYLNAMTFSDKTMYPVASRNDKDFQNLMDVYLDAVFYPCMYECPEIFMQEGWHYELEDLGAELRYKGVVYNEMKGAFSSPEAVLDKEVFASLFPDTAYGNESGGDPDHIVDLTLEGFLDFHRKYYHPSNSYIYLYGDLDIQEKLKFLDEAYLSAFSVKKIDSTLHAQDLFQSPKRLKAVYPVSAKEQVADKTFLSWNAVVGKAEETETIMALQVLEHFLLRTQSAPLKKALIDAGICKDVLSSFSDGILQPCFSIIASGSNPDQAERFQTVIYETLTALVKDGIDKRLMEASANLMEFKLREADFGRTPKGLVYNIKCMDSWLYDSDPLLELKYEEPLSNIKKGMKSDYFERLIEERFLKNKHVTLLVLEPQPGLGEQRAEEVKHILAEHKAKLSAGQLEELAQMTKNLKARQEAPDSPEALAKIPLLQLQDIKPEAEMLILEEKPVPEGKMLFHPIATNKIIYLNLYFDAEAVSQQDLPYLYLLSELLGKVATERYTYAELANEVNGSTGGISFDAVAYTDANSAELFYPKFKVKAKALAEKLPQLSALLAEILLKSRFDEKKRLKELISQLKSSLEMYFLRNAQQVASGRVLSYFSAAGCYNEQGFLSFYEFVQALEKDFDGRFAETVQKLESLRPVLFRRSGMIASLTADAELYPAFAAAFAPVREALEDRMLEKQPYTFTAERKNEGLMTSSKIQYVAKGANFRKLGFQFNGSMKVLETILRYDYMWNRIRVQGGAYGAFTQFRRNGNLAFCSYRDPNLSETLNVYDQTAAYLRSFEVEPREMQKYIIGTMSTLDTPLTSQMKGEVAAECYIRHITQEDIQKERDEVLHTTQEEIRALAPLIDACMKENYLCVLGGEAKIKENQSVFNSLKHVFE